MDYNRNYVLRCRQRIVVLVVFCTEHYSTQHCPIHADFHSVEYITGTVFVHCHNVQYKYEVAHTLIGHLDLISLSYQCFR